jgi:hypothetical protein
MKPNVKCFHPDVFSSGQFFSSKGVAWVSIIDVLVKSEKY